MKKYIKWILLFVFIFLLINLVLDMFLGGIDYKGTLLTKYERQGDNQIITTQHFEIMTPKNWVHIFRGYGEEGEALGSFLTSSGRLYYEYGIFSRRYNIVDSIFVYSADSVVANRFNVFIGKNDRDETGVSISRQHEMEFSYAIFMSKTCTDNLEDIIKGIEHMKFKKFYNIEWLESDSLNLEDMKEIVIPLFEE